MFLNPENIELPWADLSKRGRPCGRAIVVFSDDTEIGWLHILKRGFRHCAVLVAVPGGWVLHDALSHMTVIYYIKSSCAQNLVRAAIAARLHAIEVKIYPAPKRFAAPLPFSCVESVKRVLGIQLWWIITPWQLYRYLTRCSKFYY